MKTVLPWILAVGFLAATVALFSSNRTRNTELTALRAETAELEALRTRVEEADRELQAQQATLAQARTDKEELMRLRAEVRQLRDRQQEFQKEIQAAQAAADRAQEAAQAQTQQTRQIFQTSACIGILRQMDAVKHQWAVDNNRTADAVPTPQDLLPYFPNNTIPTCPGGGNYTLNAAGLPPTCSLPGHALPQ